MEYSIAHRDGMNFVGEGMWPDGRVPWDDAVAPDIEKGDRYWTGCLRSCSYCGSMHPTDVAVAIRAGARGEWADRKYGWPHKAYFTDIPNPHAGLLESRASANFKPKEHPDWIQVDEHHWREPGVPAPDKTYGKFYTVHLMDATPEERETIETHLGLHFDFMEGGKVSWHEKVS
jgi:hypothetical protein